MPLPLTHREGARVQMHYQGNLVATLTVKEIDKLRTKNKQVTFMFKDHINGAPAKEYVISGEEKVKPIANSPLQ